MATIDRHDIKIREKNTKKKKQKET